MTRTIRSGRSSSRPARSFGLTVATLAAGLMLGLTLLVAGAGAAQAHARFLASEPANGSTLTTAPASVRLTFNEDVLAGSAKLRLDGPAGAAAVGEVVVRTTTVAAALPPDLGSGTYTVTWRVTSADGHPISGAFRFTLTLPAAASSPASASPSAEGSATGAPSDGASSASGPTAASASASLDTTPVTVTTSSTDGGATPLVVGALAATLAVAGGLWWWRSRRRP